ncbi:MAG: I78 family peptidase inhibitor [Pseudomonadota bacterium]
MKRLFALIALAGCTAAEPPLPPQLEDTCGARQFADLIGQDATSLERVLLLGPVRVIRPGDAVTRDFRVERINFMIDENETIRSIDCG